MRQISVKNIYNPPQRLEPGRVDKEHLTILIDISSIRSAKVILALYEYYSHGKKERLFVRSMG
uniref:Regulatory protein FanB n=1 Tax=Escherichia coli O169:H41 TaxID=1446701 RepID=A0A0S3PN79_ECOLX|nr:adhesin biosynthesis transcription regulatory family protein [Escherichia coli]BAT57218.1 regulatory protein FanB [Escherichia coli O169:H41]